MFTERMTTLHGFAVDRLRAAFGEPKHTLGRDHHWAVRPGPTASPIDILLNHGVDRPAIWIFDSHNGENGVVKTALTTESDVDLMISQIQERLQKTLRKISNDHNHRARAQSRSEPTGDRPA